MLTPGLSKTGRDFSSNFSTVGSKAYIKFYGMFTASRTLTKVLYVHPNILLEEDDYISCFCDAEEITFRYYQQVLRTRIYNIRDIVFIPGK